VAKERARRRAERLAVLEREKAARARRVARRQRRRTLVARLRPRTRKAGRLHRRSRGERIGIAVVPLLAVAVIWLLVPDLALRIVLTAMIVIAVPALVVLILGRRS
jgi:Flp pilus assembly protein TadB